MVNVPQPGSSIQIIHFDEWMAQNEWPGSMVAVVDLPVRVISELAQLACMRIFLMRAVWSLRAQ